MIDAWRFSNPDGKDYSFYSYVHMSYSRIDYFFLKHHQLTCLWHTAIGQIAITDHVPVEIEMELSDIARAPYQWRLNKSLLYDPVILGDLIKELSLFFSTNSTPDSSPLMVWEAHKAYIRGILIKHGSRVKKTENVKLSI